MCEPAKPHSRPALAELFWGDLGNSQALSNLRISISRLNGTLTEAGLAHVLQADRNTLALHLEPGDLWCDVHQLNQLWLRHAKHGWADIASDPAIRDDMQVLPSLLSGDFLANLALRGAPTFDQWVLTQDAQAKHRATTMLQPLAEGLLQLGDTHAALEAAQNLIALDDWREDGQAIYLRALAAIGGRNDVQRQFDKFRSRLHDALHIEPSAAMTNLVRELTRVPVSIGDSAPASLRANVLPFVDRPDETNMIATQLADPAVRLIVLLGMGGAGKTRLAWHTQATHGARYPDGSVFVALGSLDEVGQIVPAILATLKIPASPGLSPEAQLLQALAERCMLLILDNFDHLTDGAMLVHHMIEAAPGLTVLVTSRHVLGLRYEQLIQCDGLSHPQPDEAILDSDDARLNRPVPDASFLRNYGALSLFEQRASRVKPGFTLSPGNAAGVMRICALVEGLPLAIELAAAWARAVSPDQIADQIARDVAVLSTRAPDALTRHRSMQAVFDHSWNLLSSDERAVMQSLTVYRGGFDFPAAQAVLSDMVAANLRDALAALCDKSMLRFEHGGRYSVHALIQQMAARDVDNQALHAVLRARHSQHYLGWLTTQFDPLHSRRQQVTLAQLALEFDNFRAAWTLACEAGRINTLANCMQTLVDFCVIDGRLQVLIELLELAHAHATPATLQHARISTGLANAMERSGNYARAQALLLDALPVLRLQSDALPLARGHLELGKVMHRLYRESDATAELDLAFGLYRTNRDAYGQALALHWRGTARDDVAALPLAIEELRDARELWHSLGDPRALAQTLNSLGIALDNLGRYGEAIPLYQQALAIFRHVQDRSGCSIVLSNLADVAHAMGDTRTALRHLSDAFDYARVVWLVPSMLLALAKSAQALWSGGRYVDAVFAAALPMSSPRTPTRFKEMLNKLTLDAEHVMTEETLRDALRSGEAQTLEAAGAWMRVLND